MIKIITTSKIFKVDITMEDVDSFMQSGQQFLKTPSGEWINRSAIMSIELEKQAYWGGYPLDEKETFFIREGEKVFLSPQDKKEIEYKYDTNNPKLTQG